MTPVLDDAIYWPEKEDMPFIWCQTNPEKKVWIDKWQAIDFTNFNFADKSYAEPKRGNRIINGIALVLGQTIHKQYYTFALDFDGSDAVVAWFGNWGNVLKYAQKTRIEWHGDKGHIHVLFKSKNYLGDGKNCRIEDIGPNKEKIEIRIERQLLFSWPSKHPQNEIFTPLGTEKILELTPGEMYQTWDKIRRLSAEYTSNVNRRKYIQDVEHRYDMNTGQGIHYALVDLAVTYYLGLYGECKGLDDFQRKVQLEIWASKQNRNSQKELDGVWDWVERTFSKDKEESRAKWETVEEEKEEEKKKHIETVFKYSKNKKQPLHEAIILGDKPVFIVYDKNVGIIKSLERIEEDNRILVPPSVENYSDDPYEFENMNEVLSYMERVKTATIDSLYQEAKNIARDYNDQSVEKICLLAINIIASYFQDHFPTTHYDIILGFNGSGKSSFAITYTAIGYRVVNLTSPNAANINRILGKVEAGQCTLVLDEVKGLEKNSDLLSVLATGYDAKGKVSKVNDFTRRPEFFSTFCYKLVIGEGLSNLRELKGVMDRSFKFSAYRGSPKYDIKETLEPQGNKRRKARLEQLKDFRKLMLVYRLLNFDIEIPDIDAGVDGREKELVKPILQLFFGSEAQREVESTLQAFLNQRNEKKDATIEPLLHRILTDLIGITENKEEGFVRFSKFARKSKNEVYQKEVWGTLKWRMNAKDDLKDPHQAYTEEYGTIYNRNIGEILEHTFGGKLARKKMGNTYTFDPENLKKVGKGFNIRCKVQSSLVKGDRGDEGDVTGEEHPPKSDEGVEDVYLDIKSKTDNNRPKTPKKRGKRIPSTDTLTSPTSPFRQKCYYCTWSEVCTQDEFKAHLEKCSELERDRLS